MAEKQEETPVQDEKPNVEASSLPAPAPASNSEKPAAEKKISRKPVRQSFIDIDKKNPRDFEGEVKTNNELPSLGTIREIEDYIVLDRHGRSHAFKSLYSGNNVARRVMVIFIRHFYCGMCQDYIRTLSETITPDSLLALPLSTFIVIVGCGDSAFIDDYAKTTKCQFPIYTDPKRSLYDALGMQQTLNLGGKPAYIKQSLLQSTMAGIAQGLKAIPSGLMLKAGNQRQVGGEFLFEPADMVTPIGTPKEQKQQQFGAPDAAGGNSRSQSGADDDDEVRVEEKRVTWCHRMKSTRDHCEMPELMEVLGMSAKQHNNEKEEEKWDKASRSRKGTGNSMARQMSELSAFNGVGPAATSPVEAPKQDA
ncbi:AhpC/TSA antioxidant enzyme-domain-containing protein [Emericellopsis atlantica]|uniref:AhpC/TSA antioxidant enzyme-domain-containing protein n=1 Tax=Emericellopsis atlantica TaxID=2614577 RepID=A0A9P7ZQ87_9HYPO|nr:AhpC/TSA antioxidant enzyme-domain-containing protein [Emericellopsis atlantica]KAG9255797.1 AhpC/TSA antioxidant enzyme-domain-containing protein [Emericellopsis atlantica]